MGLGDLCHGRPASRPRRRRRAEQEHPGVAEEGAEDDERHDREQHAGQGGDHETASNGDGDGRTPEERSRPIKRAGELAPGRRADADRKRRDDDDGERQADHCLVLAREPSGEQRGRAERDERQRNAARDRHVLGAEDGRRQDGGDDARHDGKRKVLHDSPLSF